MNVVGKILSMFLELLIILNNTYFRINSTKSRAENKNAPKKKP